MKVRVLAFARVREILGSAEREIELSNGALVADAWNVLVAQHPELAPLSASTRLARNGRIAQAGDELHDGDELALLPPSGGG